MKTKAVLHSVLLLIFLALTSLLAGCTVLVAGAAAAGTVGYVRGDLEAVLEDDIDEVYNASIEGLEDLEIPVISKEKDALSAKVIARTVEDKKVTVKMDTTETGLTKLSIRIGVFGDETKSRMIYNKIKDNL